MNPRLHALLDLDKANARVEIGLHEYDGQVTDLSPAGVRSGLARLGDGPAEPDDFDERVLRVGEECARVVFGEFEQHRTNPWWHMSNLDLSCYIREYAPASERTSARQRHLAQWPDAVDVAIEALDAVRAPVARGLLPSARGLREDVDPNDPAADDALRALDRFVSHLEVAAANGDPDASIGGPALAKLMAAPDGMVVDLRDLATTADRERTRLTEMLTEACDKLHPGGRADVREVIEDLLRDHPRDAEGIYEEARSLIEEITKFTLERELIDDVGGECLVGPAPPSQSWAMAMMVWAAPFELDAPSWYWVTPPDPSWPADQQEEWLSVFSRTTLPGITAHEVTPGHFTHGRMMRKLTSDVRRCVMSFSFGEGWAHYTEELLVEEGFRADDPRFTIGVCIEALIRVTRLAFAIGLHTDALTLEDGTRMFENDAFLTPAAARSEAMRATFNPDYGHYTWGKLAILDVRERARSAWGADYSHRRFHNAILALGSPPLGLLDHALVTG